MPNANSFWLLWKSIPSFIVCIVWLQFHMKRICIDITRPYTWTYSSAYTAYRIRRGFWMRYVKSKQIIFGKKVLKKASKHFWQCFFVLDFALLWVGFERKKGVVFNLHNAECQTIFLSTLPFLSLPLYYLEIFLYKTVHFLPVHTLLIGQRNSGTLTVF